MNKFLQIVAFAIGKPLLEKAAAYLVDYLRSEYETYKMRKRQEKMLKEIEQAKGEDEIRAVNRKLDI